MGATRRLDHYEASTGWHPLFVIVSNRSVHPFMRGVASNSMGFFGALKIARRIWDHDWRRSLEWQNVGVVHSFSPSIYNFAIIPTVDQIDPLWATKRGEAPNRTAI